MPPLRRQQIEVLLLAQPPLIANFDIALLSTPDSQVRGALRPQAREAPSLVRDFRNAAAQNQIPCIVRRGSP
jgi:hypothetical protein